MNSNSQDTLYSKTAAVFFGGFGGTIAGASLRCKLILKYLNPRSGERILDIGCNRGVITKKIQKYSKNVMGIDINREAVKRAITPSIICMDATNMSFPQNYFDKIYSAHVIEHIPDMNKFIKEVERVLKPGGRVVLIYPFEIFRGSQTLFWGLVICKDLLGFRKLHLHRLTPNKIRKLVAGTSLNYLKTDFHFDPSPAYYTILEKKRAHSSAG